MLVTAKIIEQSIEVCRKGGYQIESLPESLRLDIYEVVRLLVEIVKKVPELWSMQWGLMS